MNEISKKYNLIPLNNGDFQLNLSVVGHLPEIKFYIKNHGDYFGIYDGGTTVSSIFMIMNLSSPEFQTKLYEICKTYKISKDKNVFFVETYPKDFDQRLKDFATAINQIATITTN